MDEHSSITIVKTSLTVAASGTMYSIPIDLAKHIGYFSVQITVSGSGTLSLAYELSNHVTDPLTFSTPVGASAIATGLTAGTYLYEFTPVIGKWLRLVFTETGTSDSVTIVSRLAGQ